MTLYILRGLMGCGKSTKARQIQIESGGRIVERDQIRMMLYGSYTDCDEMKVTNVQMSLIEEGLRMSENVIVSDMNLRQKYVTNLIKLAMKHGTDYEIVDMTNVTLQTCLRQNENLDRRIDGKNIPEDVIFSTYNKFIKGKGYPLPVPHVPKQENERRFEPYERNESLPDAIIVDLDGTLAHMNGRGPFDEHLVSTDYVDVDVAYMVQAAHAMGAFIVFMSGRSTACYEDTFRWIQNNLLFLEPGGQGWALNMRREIEDAGRPDDDVKYDLFNKEVAPYFNVRYAIDDRNKVVNMWRAIGLKCAQVEKGDF